MLATDCKELLTRFTSSLVKEFRSLQDLLDILQEEQLAIRQGDQEKVGRLEELRTGILQEIVENARQREEDKHRLAKLLGLDGKVTYRILADALEEDTAVQISNMIEGSLALWKLAGELDIREGLGVSTDSGVQSGCSSRLHAICEQIISCY